MWCFWMTYILTVQEVSLKWVCMEPQENILKLFGIEENLLAEEGILLNVLHKVTSVLLIQV